MQGVVLLLAAEHLDGAAEFLLAADERMMAGEGVVQAGDESLPLVGVGLFVALVVVVHFAFALLAVFVGFDEVDHEVFLAVAKVFLQQVAGPRVFHLEQRPDQMGHIETAGAGEDHHVVGGIDQLFHLHRRLGRIVGSLGNALNGLQVFLHLFGEHDQIGIVVDDRQEDGIVEQGAEHVLGHDKLVVQGHAFLHRGLQQTGSKGGIIDFWHFLLSILVRKSVAADSLHRAPSGWPSSPCSWQCRDCRCPPQTCPNGGLAA